MARYTALFIFTALLTYAYLYPGSQALVEGRTDTVMSDGTDITGMGWIWDSMDHIWKTHPSRYFYGAVYNENADPDHGSAWWFSWSERWTGLALAQIVPFEQVSTGIVFLIIILNVFAMYGLGQYLKWNTWVSLGLALAWAFTAYARARAQVHPAFAGTFHIPLIFLSLFLVVRGKSRQSLFAAAVFLLLSSTLPLYYVITAAFLTPFFLLFVWLQPETRANLKRISSRLVLAILPAIAFLAFNVKVPVPSDVKDRLGQPYPTTGDTPPGMTHPFLTYYAARPIDFLTSDIALHPSPGDPNPLKQLLNNSVFNATMESPANGNPHERTNGIRWFILILAGLGTVAALRKQNISQDPARRNILFFILLAIFSLTLSLSPASLYYGPSAWLQSLVSQIRVPSRAGIWVHFCALMIVGFYLSTHWANRKLKKFLLIPAVFPALVIAEYPPFWRNMRMAPIAPAYSELTRDKGECGVGMYFPFVNNFDASIIFYGALERIRGTDCSYLNSLADPKQFSILSSWFPPARQYLDNLSHDVVTPMRLEKLARCIPLSFIAFDPVTPPDTLQKYCAALGWTLNADLTCVSHQKGQKMQHLPLDCQ